MSEKVRFTISLDADVHAQFVKLAAAEGKSLSASVGSWLESTAESVTFLAHKMRQLRLAPVEVLRELETIQASASGDYAETRRLIAKVVEQGGAAPAGGGRRRRTAAAGAVKPPCSPTGVKESTRKGRNP